MKKFAIAKDPTEATCIPMAGDDDPLSSAGEFNFFGSKVRIWRRRDGRIAIYRKGYSRAIIIDNIDVSTHWVLQCDDCGARGGILYARASYSAVLCQSCLQDAEYNEEYSDDELDDFVISPTLGDI